MDKIEALGAMIHMSQTEEWSAGQLGASVVIPRGSGNIGPLLTEARLDEIERRILAIEAAIQSSNPSP